MVIVSKGEKKYGIVLILDSAYDPNIINIHISMGDFHMKVLGRFM